MKEGVDALGRVRAQAIVLLVLAFLAGAFAGGAIERVSLRQFGARAFSRGFGRGGPGNPGGPGGPGGRAGRGGGGPRGGGPRTGLPGVYESLGLSDAQRAQVDSIVKKRRTRVDSLMQASCAVFTAAYDSTNNDIVKLLTAEQRAKFEAARPRGRGFGGPCGPPRGTK